MAEIKASELLVKISKDIDNLTQIVKLQSYQYTLILKKLNELGQNKVEPVPNPAFNTQVLGTVKATENPPLGSLAQSKNSSSTVTPTEKIFQTTVQLNQQPVKRNTTKVKQTTDYNFNDSPDSASQGNSSVNNSQPVPVTQIVYTSTGKPIAIAMVEIKNEDGSKILQKIKTNSVGRWNALVPPGKYIVHLTRRYDSETIDYEQSIEIGPSNHQVEIPPPEQYRRKPKGTMK